MIDFTIITATRDAAAKIEGTIESVMSQDRSLFEYLVVDGGSTDDTLPILAGYGDALSVISGSDHGIYEAFNKGIARARGRFLYFLGAGDRMRPGVLARVAERLPAHEHALVYGNAWCVRPGNVHNGKFTKGDLVIRNICHQAAFYGRDVFNLLGPYPLRYPINADWFMNIRCFGDPRIDVTFIDEIIADYEGGGASEGRADSPFIRDLPTLIRQSLGWKYSIAYQWYLLRQRMHKVRAKIGI